MSTTSFGVEVPILRYVASYNADGFRTNSSAPPFDVVLLGDSYLEIGVDDRDTLSERLKDVSGWSTQNLGRGWYGPGQYVELYRRYGPTSGAKYVVLCFFDGNDIEDTRQYVKWQKGGDYRTFVLGRKWFFKRYLVALSDTLGWVRKSVMPGTARSSTTDFDSPTVEGTAGQIHPQEAVIRLGDEEVRMRFVYWNNPMPTDQSLEQDGWRALRGILARFKALANEQGAMPVLLFIPTKLQVYGWLATDQRGGVFREKIVKQMMFETNSAEALRKLAAETGIELLSLQPHFRELARQGRLLYYTLDTHWNSAGRQAAAELLAASLRRLGDRPLE